MNTETQLMKEIFEKEIQKLQNKFIGILIFLD